MATTGELLRYSKYIIENKKDVNVTIEGVLVTAVVKKKKLYIPTPDGTNYLVIDFQQKSFFTANEKMIITAESKPSRKLVDVLVNEFRKYFQVYETVLANAGFALYGSKSDHEEGLV